MKGKNLDNREIWMVGKLLLFPPVGTAGPASLSKGPWEEHMGEAGSQTKAQTVQQEQLCFDIW